MRLSWIPSVTGKAVDPSFVLTRPLCAAAEPLQRSEEAKKRPTMRAVGKM
jgi:hypothetical protein